MDTGTGGIGTWFNDPNNVALIAGAAGQLGASLSNPGSPGAALGNIATQMAQARAMSKVRPNPLAQPTPTATSASGTTSTEAAPNILEKAKQISKLGSILKNAHGIDPSLIPPDFNQTLGQALAANSNIQNPTVPASREQASAGVLPQLSDALAMTMTPDQLTTAFGTAINADRQDIERGKLALEQMKTPSAIAETWARTAYMNNQGELIKWQMDPARVAEKIKENTAPVLAQIDVLKAKDQLNKDNVALILKDNPSLGNLRLPGGLTVGQQLLIAAADPDAAKNISGIIQQGIAYDAAKYSADAHFKAAQATAAASGDIKNFQIQTTLYEKANADIAKWEAAPTQAQWDSMDKLQKMGAAAKGIMGPRTPALEEAIKSAKITRDSIGAKLYGPAYSKLQAMEEAHGAPSAGTIVVTPEMLKQSVEGKRATTTDKSDYFQGMFNGGTTTPFNPGSNWWMNAGGT